MSSNVNAHRAEYKEHKEAAPRILLQGLGHAKPWYLKLLPRGRPQIMLDSKGRREGLFLPPWIVNATIAVVGIMLSLLIAACGGVIWVLISVTRIETAQQAQTHLELVKAAAVERRLDMLERDVKLIDSRQQDLRGDYKELLGYKRSQSGGRAPSPE